MENVKKENAQGAREEMKNFIVNEVINHVQKLKKETVDELVELTTLPYDEMYSHKMFFNYVDKCRNTVYKKLLKTNNAIHIEDFICTADSVFISAIRDRQARRMLKLNVEAVIYDDMSEEEIRTAYTQFREEGYSDAFTENDLMIWDFSVLPYGIEWEEIVDSEVRDEIENHFYYQLEERYNELLSIK